MAQTVNHLEKIAIPSSDGFILAPLIEIYYCRSDGNYTDFFLTEGRMVTSSYTLNHYAEILLEQNFLRAHKSYLINIDHITRYVKKTAGGFLLMSDGQSIQIARRSKESVLKILRRGLVLGDPAAKTELSVSRSNRARKKGRIVNLNESMIKNTENPENGINRLTLMMTVMDLVFKLNEINNFFELQHQENSLGHDTVSLANEIKQVDDQFEKLFHLRKKLTESFQKCMNKESEFVTLTPAVLAQNSR